MKGLKSIRSRHYSAHFNWNLEDDFSLNIAKEEKTKKRKNLLNWTAIWNNAETQSQLSTTAANPEERSDSITEPNLNYARN